MSDKDRLLELLDDTVEGLYHQGYKCVGGSDVWRLLRNRSGNEVKVFLNNYIRPTHIVVRHS